MSPEANPQCKGLRPWLGPEAQEACVQRPRLLMRGASNAYFYQVMSALSIPESDSALEETVRGLMDVLTQANIFNVLKRLKKELGISFILITHDIATSSELADEVAVMYAGQIVEVSDAYRFFEQPLHPYSQKLMASVPRLHGTKEPEFITGRPPGLISPPTGCRFKDRCPFRFAKCDEDPPVFNREGRLVRCWLYE